MHKIEALEKKWYHYKIKAIMIPLVSSIVTASVGVGGTYLYDKYTKESVAIHHQPITKVLSATKETNSLNAEMVMNSPLKTSKKEFLKEDTKKKLHEISLEPVIPVINLEKEESIHYRKKRVIKKYNSHKRLVKAKANDYLTAKELASMSRVERSNNSKPHVMKKIKFHATSANYIEIMKEKYSHSHSSRDALLLAKAFYKKASYKEAEEWALKANKLNAKLDESWLLFAKSKAKMGRKQEAINILAKYYQKSKSSKAKRLIGQIKTGRI